MIKYVDITYTITCCATVEVDADNNEEAIKKAKEHATGNINFIDHIFDSEVTGAEVICKQSDGFNYYKAN